MDESRAFKVFVYLLDEIYRFRNATTSNALILCYRPTVGPPLFNQGGCINCEHMPKGKPTNLDTEPERAH